MQKTRKSFSLIQSSENTMFQEALLGYLGGPVLALIANSILSVYLNLYMTNVLDLGTWAKPFLSVLPFISIIFIIAGNILVGNLIKKNHLNLGKARPLILMSLPISLLALLFLFVFLPFHSSSEEGSILTLIVLAIGYNLWFGFAFPFYFNSHLSLINLSTRDTRVRSLFGSLSMAAIIGAFGLASMILTFFLKYLFVYDLDPTLNGIVGAIPQYDSAGTLMYYTDANGKIIYDQIASFNAWKIFVIALMTITFIGVVVEFLFTRERISEESLSERLSKEEEKKTGIINQLKVSIKDKYWVLIILFLLLFQFGFTIRNISQLYYCYAWFGDNPANFSNYLSMATAIPMVLGLLIAWPLSRKIGKRMTIFVGAIVATVGGFISFFDPGNFALLISSVLIKSLGIAPSLYLGIGLLGDVLDNQEAKNNFRTDSFTMIVIGSIMVGMFALSSGIVNSILSNTNFNPANMDSPETRNSLMWLFEGAESICYLLIAPTISFLDVEKHSKENEETIIRKQKEQFEARGEVWISNEERTRLEEAQYEEEFENNRIKNLKIKCERKGLNFEEENQKYLSKHKK